MPHYRPPCGLVGAQKKSPVATEREEDEGRLWNGLASHLDARSLVFIDESGFSISIDAPEGEGASKGKRAYGRVPTNRGKKQTLIASMTLQGGMGVAMTIEGVTDKVVFEAYVEKALAPSLLEGQVVVLDGLGAHRSERVSELIEGRGCDLVFLASYSPELNPIEQAFAKVKGLLRKAEARTREALIEAMGAALSAVSARETSGFLGHCGYRTSAQLL